MSFPSRELRRESQVAIRTLLAEVFRNPGFHGLTLSDSGPPRRRTRLRPVTVREGARFAFEDQEGTDCATEILAPAAARRRLAARLQSHVGDVHLATEQGEVNARVTRSGRWLMSRHAGSSPGGMDGGAADAPGRPHDRIKKTPLNAFDSVRLLEGLELTDAHGRVRPAMGPKLRQVNAFLEVLRAGFAAAGPPDSLHLVDCGCGKAYLTFAACAWLRQVAQCDARVTGLDRAQDRIASCRRLAETLGLAEHMRFEAVEVSAYAPRTAPDLVLSLHACDTATDDALAFGVRQGARWLYAVPCCQHTMHDTLATGEALRGLLRHAILRRRFGDLLTDACRAQLLRMAGYRTTVQEFVDPEATDRNLLIRAERGLRPGRPETVAAYRELRSWLSAPPPLETALAGRMGEYLADA